MGTGSWGEEPRLWLAATVRALLEEKYGAGRVPGVRKISADIAYANGGETISHGHVHNILSGGFTNLTDRTRILLAKFFNRHPSEFFPPRAPTPLEAESVQELAARFATLDPAQLDAIRQAIEIVSKRIDQNE